MTLFGTSERVADGSVTLTHLAKLLAFVEEVLVAFDEDGTITFASPSLASVTGHHPDSAVGRSLAEFLHPEDLATALMLMSNWRGHEGNTTVSPIRVCRAGGGWVPMSVDVVAGPQVAPFGSFVATLREIGSAGEVEQRLRSRLANEARLVRLAAVFVNRATDSGDDGVERALSEMSGLSGVDRVEVVLLDREAGEWVNTHEWAAPSIPRLMPTVARVPDGETPLFSAIRRNEEVAVASVEGLDRGWDAERRWFAGRHVGSAALVPLSDQGQVIGLIGFEAVDREFVYDADHLVTLRSAAGILAQALARKAAENRLAHQARHDSLTGLPNRWAFMDNLAIALSRLSATPTRTGLAVILFDLDRFKVVNDSLGHGAGDFMLVTLAERIARARPPRSLLARMGGDEVALLVEGLSGASEAMVIADALARVMKEAIVVQGHEMAATASVGVAFATGHDRDPETAEDLLRKADAALYAAKELGRDRVEMFDETLSSKVRGRLQDEIELRHAVASGELAVHYQPEVEVPGGQIRAAEALVRWNHPTRGLLAAASFIDLAEETGLIVDIGEWVLRTACLQQVAWAAEHPDHPIVVRVNLSALQIGQSDLLHRVMAILGETGVEPGQLCLEITETTIMADAEKSLEVLEKLRGLGVELAIDDFGTGYSSLSYLKRFPVQVLKIDRSFVDGLGHDPDDTAIVQAIMVLASSLGLRVTAEGVETEAQLVELERLGCKRVQGYLFARPGPAEDLSPRLD